MMFNLLVKGVGWGDGRDAFSADRVFEYTADDLGARFKPNGFLDVDTLMRLPTLFMSEGTDNQVARVGTLVNGTLNLTRVCR